MAVKLSLAMVAKDDASTLARAIESAASFCDEILVVDLGSNDETKEIAEAHGATVHSAQWNDDFAEERNESFCLCSGEWIMWLGASDVISAEVRPAFAACKELLAEQLANVDVVVGPYRWLVADDGTPLITFHRERFVRRDAGLEWEGRVHERIAVPTNNVALSADLVVEHRPDRARQALDADQAIELLEKAFESGDRSSRTLFHFANELHDHGRYGEAVERYGDYLYSEPEGADRYWAGVYLAETFIVLEDPDQARRVALDTVGDDSSRAEAYVVLGKLHYEAEEWDEAVPLFTAATAATRPSFGLLREADYGYAPWDYLSVCFEKLGQLPNALACAQRALPGNPQADRVRSNMRWMVDRL